MITIQRIEEIKKTLKYLCPKDKIDYNLLQRNNKYKVSRKNVSEKMRSQSDLVTLKALFYRNETYRQRGPLHSWETSLLAIK